MPTPYTVPLQEGRQAFLAELDAFVAAASALDDHALLGPSRAYGWARVDCLVHVRIGLQELLAGIPATTDATPDVDAASYWTSWEEQAEDDPVPGILMTRRTASAYTRPTHALEHLGQVVDALRLVVPAMPDTPVHFQGHTLSAGDLLATWAVEVAVHHHDLDAPGDTGRPVHEALVIGRRTAEALDAEATGADDLTAMLRGFGRA